LVTAVLLIAFGPGLMAASVIRGDDENFHRERRTARMVMSSNCFMLAVWSERRS
jgi:hypothetical protein